MTIEKANLKNVDQRKRGIQTDGETDRQTDRQRQRQREI